MGVNPRGASRGLVVFLAVLLLPALAVGDDADPSTTLQQRFASKQGQPYGHAGATALIRNDFYHSVGYGLALGYFVDEDWGIEVRAQHIHSRLSHTGRQMADDYGLAPDMRAPWALFAAGGRLSWGYGKVLTLGDFLVHFDPQFVARGGITLAEERVVPTVSGGIGFLTHFHYGIQAKLDLEITFHAERRDRGVVVATGFAPVLSVGWSPDLEGW